MIEYKAVPSGLDISRRVVDCLEAAAPRDYDPGERPGSFGKSMISCRAGLPGLWMSCWWNWTSAMTPGSRRS